jgi:hypothetical protein
MRLILLVFLLVHCGDNPPVIYPTTAPYDDTKLALGPGDKLELTLFYGDEEAKQTSTLDSSGQMEVRYIGTVSAGGKTVRDVQEENPLPTRGRLSARPRGVADGRRDQLAQVLGVWTSRAQRHDQVHAGNEDRRSDLAERWVLTLARKNMVKVTRLLAGKKETYKIPVEMIAEGKRPNFPMMPGDEVFVPECPW